MAAPPADLVQAIQQQAPNDLLMQQALLSASWGESGWTDTSAGYFGFTSKTYGDAASLDASGQVAAILGPGTFQAAERSLPPGVTGAAAAEYIALGGEAPAFSTPATIRAYPTTVSGGTEYQLGYAYTPGVPIPAGGISQQEVIAQTNQPTQYGANTAYNQVTNPGIWKIITSSLGGNAPPQTPTPPANIPPVTNIGGRQNYIPPTNITVTPKGIPPTGYGQTLAQADAIAAQDLLQNPPSTYPSMSGQMASSLYQQMNPVTHATGTDAQGATKPAAGIISDAEGFLTGGLLGNDQYAPLHMAFGINLKGAAENILAQPVNNAWNAVKSALIRFGIGMAGLLLMAAGLFIIVMGVSGGGGGMPMPIPVPV